MTTYYCPQCLKPIAPNGSALGRKRADTQAGIRYRQWRCRHCGYPTDRPIDKSGQRIDKVRK